MKIFVIGAGGYPIYDDAFVQAFKDLGHDVRQFSWGVQVTSKLQNKLIWGRQIRGINAAMVRQTAAFMPDLVFIYRGTHVYPKTLRQMKALGCKIFGYNNDDPFSKNYPLLNRFLLWRHFKGGIPVYDHVFAYRAHNVVDFERVGAKSVSLLRSYYLPERNFETAGDGRFACEVIFVGHYEADGRDEAVLALVAAGVDVKLFGTGWQASSRYAELVDAFGEIEPVYGADYNVALNSAKIALVFLSKLNRDTYTRRCFEIPAVGTCMVSEYTADLAENLFKPDAEAVYFRDKEELVAKVTWLLANPDVCGAIGAAGQARLLKDGHTVGDRAIEVLNVFENL